MVWSLSRSILALPRNAGGDLEGFKLYSIAWLGSCVSLRFSQPCHLLAPQQEGGLEGLKLYGMVGVPGEEEEDVDATIAMMQQLKKEAPKLRWA